MPSCMAFEINLNQLLELGFCQEKINAIISYCCTANFNIIAAKNIASITFKLFTRCGVFATKLAKKFHITHLMSIGGALTLLGGCLMLILYIINGISISAILLPMVFTIAGVTLVRPTAITKALSILPEKAGFCSAALGLIQYSGAGLLSFLVTTFENDATIPLALLIVISGLLIALLVDKNLKGEMRN